MVLSPKSQRLNGGNPGKGPLSPFTDRSLGTIFLQYNVIFPSVTLPARLGGAGFGVAVVVRMMKQPVPGETGTLVAVWFLSPVDGTWCKNMIWILGLIYLCQHYLHTSTFSQSSVMTKREILISIKL